MARARMPCVLEDQTGRAPKPLPAFSLHLCNDVLQPFINEVVEQNRIGQVGRCSIIISKEIFP